MLKAARRALLWVRLQWMGLSAPALFVMSFILLIAAGTAGLVALPGLQRGPPLPFLDALFTMTSAVCVTGLAVADTAKQFTWAGQLWILTFIQLGGVGLITLTTLIIGALGRRMSLRSEMILAAPSDPGHRNVVQLAVTVLRYTLLVEGIGAVVLFFAWWPRFGAKDAAWHAVFHAVSAFCNAGFSTFSDSLMSHARAPVVLLVIAALIIAGGLGFLSSEELIRYARDPRRGRVRLSVHTWAAMWVTGVLLVVGTFAYAAFEWNFALQPFGLGYKWLNAFFMSATARTAGFNAVSYSTLSNAGILVTILLMMVGGNPGSTAGGLKTTTVAVLGALASARMRGKRYAILHGRSIPGGTIQRTVSVVLAASTVLLFGVFLMGIAESRDQALEQARLSFLPLVFEVVSAFCTVGLSMDLTPSLNEGSRILAILLMFIGRVGPLAFFAAISLGTRPEHLQIREAAEDLVVG